ncbi:hypothetical protein A3C24_04065 [Candidatus Roizmanbacteria bacterium RIFCSPHIGHO2_02_FULL_37_24]|uniref:Radical SAM core domain-containing protein n=1 Tax=Candidatus Roizmanbacteria bacterium RIFCSPHIGHO2_02_FULL_37_24 TaxID=1802037 RepID=A0A1F7GVB4_9BACT|nr:MAG: hypothetical protein A3C24_04065 [Candidatus Roizmanbacteria bacterium RIFCSPHIGHO2_02_FULL_37_24]
MKRYKKYPVSFLEIKKVLAAKRKTGFEFVNFTGGEPTLHPNFIEIVKFAKRIGYRTYIGTNGTMLARPDFCEKAAPFLDEISLSIHGYNNSTHDGLVKRKGAFKDIVRAIKNLDELEFKNKFANVVAIGKNSAYLEKILIFLINNGFKQVLFSNTAPEGNGLKNFKELEIRISAWKKIILKLKKISEKSDTPIRFFGLPICALNGAISLSNDIYWDARMTIEKSLEKKRRIILTEIKDLIPDRNRGKISACKNCPYQKLCFGAFNEYVKNFGQNELKFAQL